MPQAAYQSASYDDAMLRSRILSRCFINDDAITNWSRKFNNENTQNPLE